MENKISKNFKDELTKQFAIASAQNPTLNTIDGVAEKSAIVSSMGKQETNEKWSKKYKRSIDCNNPKGFSQRAHCQGRKKKLKENLSEAERTIMAKLRDLAKKYVYDDSKDSTSKDKIEKMYSHLKKQYHMGIEVEKEHKSADPKKIVFDHLSEDPDYYTKLKKVESKEATGAGSAGGFVAPLFSNPKKVEAKEATGSGSAGSYESPAFGAKSMSPKDWRGRSKTQIPGGKFVEVKKKCKKFPYCNQGDINALKLTENPLVKKVIKTLAKEFNLNESIIRKIIDIEYSK